MFNFKRFSAHTNEVIIPAVLFGIGMPVVGGIVLSIIITNFS